jgi:hypothetical protein
MCGLPGTSHALPTDREWFFNGPAIAGSIDHKAVC